MTGCDFSYRHYASALGTARARHEFIAFDEAANESRPCILLRHDVDFSLELALSMARLEAERGVRSTFFVLPHAHYNPLGAPGLGILREIVGLGHWLGLHFDLAFYAELGLPASETIRREAATLEDRLGTRLAVVAEHQPGRTPRPLDLDLGHRLDAYSPAFTRDTRYLSDSCQFWRDGCFCGFLDPECHPRLHVLVHPVWWSEEGRGADEALRAVTADRIRSAREAEREVFDHYASLTHLGNRNLFQRPKR